MSKVKRLKRQIAKCKKNISFYGNIVKDYNHLELKEIKSYGFEKSDGYYLYKKHLRDNIYVCYVYGHGQLQFNYCMVGIVDSKQALDIYFPISMKTLKDLILTAQNKNHSYFGKIVPRLENNQMTRERRDRPYISLSIYQDNKAKLKKLEKELKRVDKPK